ncbi:MAG TPA: M56 family metallopeptidase [Phaeodactylibacter sp.]|nr:M56 family metallopeptidase [Phaeodactylibacter sp.]
MYLFQTFFSDAFIRALGWTVLHSLWQAMFIALVLAGSMLLLQRRSALLRYRLSAFSLLAVLGSSVLTFAWLYETPVRATTGRSVVIDHTVAPVLAKDYPSSTLLQWLHHWSAYFEAHLPLIVTLWLLGLSFFLLRILGGLAYVEYLKVRAVTTMTVHWQQRLAELQQQLGMRQSVTLLESGLAQVPMVLGWLKPAILIPVGTLNVLTPQQVEAVIAHELAHIYRRDYLFNILQSLIEALYYFNPAVWWISAYIRMERENCCDDMAVALCGNSLDYAKALMQIEEAGQQHARLAMAMARKSKGQLLLRVKRILNQPQNKVMMIEKFTATAMLLAVVLFFSVSAAPPNQAGNNPEVHFTLPTLTQPQMSLLPLDSLPKGHIQIRTDHGGKAVDAELKDGSIVRLEIDGTAIPESEFPQYESMLEDMLSNVPPPPPPPPAPPALPEPPPAPQLNDLPEPPAPPAPPKVKRLEIKKQKGTDGGKVIIIEEDGEREVFRVSPEYGYRLSDEEVIIQGDSNVVVRRFGAAPPAGENRIYRFEMDDVMDEEELERIISEAQEKAARAMEQIDIDYDIDIDMDSVFSEEFRREFKDLKIITPGEGNWGYKVPKGGFDLSRMPLMNTSGLKSSIEQEMLRDGFITSTEDYKFVLKGNGLLRINGKRMPEGVFERYKRIYEREAGIKMGEGDEIKITR